MPVSARAVMIAAINACRRQTSIQARTGSSSGLGAKANAIPNGIPVANASRRRTTGYRAAAMSSVVCPSSSSYTTGANVSTATATSRRSIGARPRVSRTTPVARIATPIRVIVSSAVVGETRVRGRAISAVNGE